MLALLVGAVVLMAGCDWTAFRFGADRTGFNPVETSIGIANDSTLTEEFTMQTGREVLSSPAVANGVVYFTSTDKQLYAVDATGANGCSGSPKVCTPLWTATLGGESRSSPAVANGIVYATSDDGTLAAFDATGVTSCGGMPKVCAPLWTAHIGDSGFPSPAIVSGVLYVEAPGPTGIDALLLAFDAAGTTGCGGVPKTCTPLWTADLGSQDTLTSPAIAGGRVYAATTALLQAFDAAGNTGCTGVPKICTPLWTAQLLGGTLSSPAVAGGRVFISTLSSARLEAYDAAGVTNCTHLTHVCSPLWVGSLGGLNGHTDSSPAVVHGIVYVGAWNGLVYAFDAAGSVGCNGGTPNICPPLWTALTTEGGQIESSPSVANGVLYIGSNDNNLYAFDAAGNSSCTGTPKVCSPLWTTNAGGVFSSPTIVSGRVYVGSYDGKLHAYGLSP